MLVQGALQAVLQVSRPAAGRRADCEVQSIQRQSPRFALVLPERGQWD